VKEIFKNAGSVTAAEAVVDHAYGRASGAVGVAMSPTAAMQEVSDSRSVESGARWESFRRESSQESLNHTRSKLPEILRAK
jgi:hypothetical protein